MTTRFRARTLAFASLLAVVAAAPLASFAATPLPGQPGADTSVGEELRAQPYPASGQFSQPMQPATTMMTSQNSPSVYDSLSLPDNLVFN